MIDRFPGQPSNFSEPLRVSAVAAAHDNQGIHRICQAFYLSLPFFCGIAYCIKNFIVREFAEDIRFY